jgi:hypothetical protein
MKMAYDEQAAAARMRPGALTAAGFLGDDPRSPADIIAADEAAAAALGLDWAAAADVLALWLRRGAAGLGADVDLGGGLTAVSDEARGRLACPFRDGVYPKNAVAVSDGTGGRLILSDLSIHLWRAHRFCQGRGSPFRLEPALVAAWIKAAAPGA